MKKSVLLTLIGIMLAVALTACGALNKPRNGTYKSEGFLSQSWTFSGGNSITLSAGIISTDGTYEIEGSTLYVTSTLLGVETTSSYTITEIKSDSFFIDGTKFVRQ